MWHFFVENADSDDKSATGPFTSGEITNFEDLLSESQQWYSATVEKLRTMDPTTKPTVTSADIYRRVEKLDREVKYLITRARLYRPPTPKAAPKSDAQNTTKTESSEKPEGQNGDSDTNQEGIKLEFPESQAEQEARQQAEQKRRKAEADGGDETLQLDGEEPEHNEL